MSSLQRYKKSGGFVQLLSLIETFGPQKKEKFLEMIESESAAWAAALREKMITLDRVFGWPDQVVVEVFKRLPVKSQAYAQLGLKDEQKAKIAQFYSQSEQRRLTDVLNESQPKPEEIQATLFKVVEIARKMIHDRELTPEKFDAALSIPEDYESKIELNSASMPKAEPKVMATSTPEPEAAASHPHAGAEVIQLQRSLSTMLKENKALKEENRVLQSRLDNIRKLAG